MHNLRTVFREPSLMWPNLAAIAYIVVTYFGGFWLLFQGGFWSILIGIVAVMHGMTIAAYLMHECGHNTIFKTTQANARLGRWLNVVTGSNYGTYEDMRYKHMRHHVDNCEPITFDYRTFLRQHPRLHRLVIALEWAYIPAVEYVMHGLQMIAPFVYDHKKDQRARVLRVIAVRGGIFVALLIWAPWVALAYLVAYTLFLTFLRFLDSYQHSYEIFYQLADPNFHPPKKGDRDYEEHNTYTNLLSARWPWLNLLALNFPYHNAHHDKPTLNWVKLPAYHASLYPAGCPQQLGFWPQLRSFHRNRVARIMAEEYGEEAVIESVNQGRAVGVNALSFLTAF